MFLKCLFLYIYVVQVCSMEYAQIECDSISNTDFGRRFCFIRHMNNENTQNMAFKSNPIADEKRELIVCFADNC